MIGAAGTTLTSINVSALLLGARPPTPYFGAAPAQYEQTAVPEGKPRITKSDASLTNVVSHSLRSNWARLQNADLPADIDAKIRQLSQLAEGWRGRGSKPLTADSLRTFLDFWGHLPTARKKPFIALSPSGTIFLEWHRTWKKHLDVECANDGTVVFGLIRGETVIEGKAPASEAVATLNAGAVSPFGW
jgi:hypothetical protein